jgi:glycosyltransferase involved in cell wall biosynthesis
MSRKKILISAYACLPDAGSEPGMGWNWISRLVRYHDIWLLTEENRYAPVITQYISEHPELQGHLHVIGIPRERYGEKIWSHFYYLSYRKWQKLAYQKALELSESIQFDLVHQLNMIGYREPGFLWQLPVPFIWGPIGGHAQMPWAYLPSLGFKGAIHYGLRNVLNAIQMRWMPRVKKAMNAASVLLAATVDDQHAIKKYHGLDSILIGEIGSDTEKALQKKIQRKQDGKLRIVWCGVFLARKGLPLGLKALKKASKYADFEFHIIGGGKCEQEWKELAEKLQIDHFCYWHGNVEHKTVFEILESCDVFLCTSLQDATSTVIIEAIEIGLPIICHDMCGFGTCVDESSGIKIPPQSPAVSIDGFAHAIRDLEQNPEKLSKLKSGTKKRALELSWDSKVQLMLELIDKI